MTLATLRRLEWALEASGEDGRLLRRHRGAIQQLLAAWLEEGEKAGEEGARAMAS